MFLTFLKYKFLKFNKFEMKRYNVEKHLIFRYILDCNFAILNQNIVMLYIFGKLWASSKQWFKLYIISSKQENALGV